MIIEAIIMLLAMALPIIYVVSGDGKSEETEYERTRVFTHYPDGRVEEEDEY